MKRYYSSISGCEVASNRVRSADATSKIRTWDVVYYYSCRFALLQTPEWVARVSNPKKIKIGSSKLSRKSKNFRISWKLAILLGSSVTQWNLVFWCFFKKKQRTIEFCAWTTTFYQIVTFKECESTIRSMLSSFYRMLLYALYLLISWVTYCSRAL